METLRDEVSGKIREINYFLWQSILAVNSLMATLLIAIAAIGNLTQINQLLAFAGFTLSACSCVIMVTNFMSTKEVYSKIFDQISKSETSNTIIKEQSLVHAVKIHSQNTNNERLALIISLFSLLIIVKISLEIFRIE